ncbi:uncharacterized protein LOC135696495 [Rhopilema esculentum]|uniref:uncharacterized protein LOC135696495 n=1 Tax=Rhopilema esculentum TaxID=499914 RepID=UPI0031DD012E
MEGSETKRSVERMENGTAFPSIGDNLICSLQEENRSLKIRIAGVDTLSSLLRGTRDELETVCAEKESLEVELARLQCKYSLLEKDMTAKEALQNTAGPTNQMFESVLKQNKKLKEELQHSRKAAMSTESIFGPEALSELVSFKEDLEMEIKNLQKAMRNKEEDTSISQVARLLGQVTKLEYQLKAKEEECVSLKSEIDAFKVLSSDEKSKDQLLQNSFTEVESKEISLELTEKKEVEREDFSSQFAGLVMDVSTQTSSEDDIFKEKNTIKKEFTHKDFVQQRNQCSLTRKNSKRASGEWNLAKKRHSDLFEDDWNIDKINTTEQLKVTQELLVQANELIGVLTEENDRLLQVNAMLLQDTTKTDNQKATREEVLDRLRFLFSECSYDEADYKEIGCIQDIEMSHLHGGEGRKGFESKDEYKGSEAKQLSKEEVLINNNKHPMGNIIGQMDKKGVQIEETKQGITTSCDDFFDHNNVDHGSVMRSGDLKSKAGPKCVHTRDSGVDICVLESERNLTDHIIGKVEECPESSDGSSKVREGSDENIKLRKELELKDLKLKEVEEKISKMEAELRSLETKTKTMAEGKLEGNEKAGCTKKRLWKSIGHIPSSVHSTTHQRIVFESDV